MLRKKDFVFGSVVIYILLIMLMLLVEEKEHFHLPCSYYQPCVRFCCNNQSSCKENYIRENFNSSLVPVYRYDGDEKNETSEEEKVEFIIFQGHPKCLSKMISANDKEEKWKFDEVKLVIANFAAVI
jgi:hypothetical protein